MKNWIIKTLGLKGSWKWAKGQMLKGKIVRCRHWRGTLKLKIDSPKNRLLQCDYSGAGATRSRWETSNWHINYEDFTDYEVFEWINPATK